MIFDCQLGPTLQRRVVSTCERRIRWLRGSIRCWMIRTTWLHYHCLTLYYHSMSNLPSDLRSGRKVQIITVYALPLSRIALSKLLVLVMYNTVGLPPPTSSTGSLCVPYRRLSKLAKSPMATRIFSAYAVPIIPHLPTVLSLFFHFDRALWTANTGDSDLQIPVAR